MAKNLKLNVKNAQLAQALKLGAIKRPATKKKKPVEEEAPLAKMPAIHEPQVTLAPEPSIETVASLTESQAKKTSTTDKATKKRKEKTEELSLSESTPPSPPPAPMAAAPAPEPAHPTPVDHKEEPVSKSEPTPPPMPHSQTSYSQPQRTGGTYPPRQQGGYPPRREEGQGYPPRQPSGYPPRQASGYPPRREEGQGYPPRQSSGYPPRREEGQGYPPRQASGYPPRREEGQGYPPRQPSGYPPRREEGQGYPPRQPSGYPPRREDGQGYPPRQTSGYPPRQPSGYPPRQPGGYPPRREGGSGYPPRPGYSSDRRPGTGFTPGGYPPRRPYSPGQPGGAPRAPFAPRGPILPDEGKGDRKKTFEDAPRKAPQKDFREHKQPAKKQEERSFDARDRYGLRGDLEEQGWRKRRSAQKMRPLQQEEIIRPKTLAVRIPITVKDLAFEMKLKASQLIAKLFMKGIVITLNDFLDDETTIQLLGQDFDCGITIDRTEEDRLRITDKTIKQEIQDTPPEHLILRPPVVTFMGHVDHGKTSLIDKIRKSDIAGGEAGAITQHIGAFKCHTVVGDLTILDTPGHEAFSAMRSRGADITDIVVLVIAGDEGMRTQTLEALQQAQAANVPILVALNKCDKPNFNSENVYRQLSEHNLLPEKWGGQTIVVNCSAVTGEGIKELLEMLALQAEVLELKADPHSRARGSVIESEMHKGMGVLATILVQNGTLRLGDALVFSQQFARIKTMHNEHDQELKEAGPSTPVKITGLSDLPAAGSEFIVVKNEKEAMEIAEKRTEGQRHAQLHQVKRAAESFLAEKATGIKKKILNLIIRADVQGSVEALKNSLLKIVSKKIELNIISAAVGEISESDIQLASASKATILGFHTRVESHAESLIKTFKVTVKLHDIIYHAVDDIRALMLSMLDKVAQETDIGSAEVKAVFKASQLGNIAGCSVLDGTIKRSSHVKQLRENQVIWKGPIHSLKRAKEDAREVTKGYECGIVLQNNNDVKVGDILQAFEITYLEQEL